MESRCSVEEADEGCPLKEAADEGDRTDATQQRQRPERTDAEPSAHAPDRSISVTGRYERGRMLRSSGDDASRAAVEAAKADGRWDEIEAGLRDTVADDLAAAIAADPVVLGLALAATYTYSLCIGLRVAVGALRVGCWGALGERRPPTRDPDGGVPLSR